MATKGTPKKPAAPATVLVITLEPDGNGSLLARRGDLAHLSQFTYRGLTEIVNAIQQSATALIGIEENPPSVDVPAVSASPIISDDETSDKPADTVDAEPSAPVNPPQPDPLALPSEPQLKLM